VESTARWRLREALFNLGAQPPEHFAPWRARGLQLFAYAVWVYRLVLFLGIAFFVLRQMQKNSGKMHHHHHLGWQF
jgi:putative peptide zinc metalloprotease protein